jgi:HK97 family phage portal protein
MRVFGYELTRARPQGSTVPAGVAVGGPNSWFSVIREPFTGAWQQNLELSAKTAASNPTVYSCTTLIMQSMGKMRLRLVELTTQGTWVETTSAAFSPVLRRPNRYQLIHEFIEYWIGSKVQTGNTYVLKQRDQRGVVVALSVLDPAGVTVLVAPDGSVYYQLTPSDLAGIPQEGVAVPASEIIHDKLSPLFHPLVGLSPIYAAALSATQGTKILENSTQFFANGSSPGGVITVPVEISKEAAQRVAAEWNTNYTGVNAGKVAVLVGGMKYDPTTVNATDAQLIEQLKWTEQVICGCYKVPMSLINSAPVPYANNEPLVQQFYSQCLQTYIVALENALDDGLGLTSVPGRTYGTEFDIDDLLWMDTATRTKAATDAVSGGVLSPNEARFKYFGLGKVAGGDTPYMQQQMFSLEALSERDSINPFSQPAAPPAATATEDENDDDDANEDADAG